MSKSDYIPRRDGEFLQWAKSFLEYVLAHAVEWNIPESRTTDLETELFAYENAYKNAQNPNRGKANVLHKNITRDTLKKSVRVFVNEFLAYSSDVTDEDRERMGLRIRDKKPTPAPIPTEVPTGSIDFSTHQRHTLYVRDTKLSGRAKPETVRGYEVWHKVGGEAPVEDGQWVYVSTSSRASFIIDYPQTDVGKIAYYRFRWINTRNQPGPWSDGIISAVIG
ncbi:MAG: hypothetical protein LBQ73_11570 [Tannerellaceae bacterium]|jgi:hypothetical protein|nr:hypothetical protein [Tannerellaceae bacterium]